MALLCSMCKMQNDPGIGLDIVAWLKVIEVTLLVSYVALLERVLISSLSPMSTFEIWLFVNENNSYLLSSFYRKLVFQSCFTVRALSSPTFVLVSFHVDLVPL